ncbi:MAG: serine hydrolase [Chloroflexi bacterium]|nr:serine hydrolase [Chloroflexota bacterium]
MTIHFDPALIEQFLSERQGDDAFSGVILVRENGIPVLERAGGFAQRADRLPNTLHTRLGTASGTKTFTAAAICQLVERGLVNFETPLKDCVGVSLPSFDPDITLHHLLSHTSGVPDYFDEETMADEDYERLWLQRPMYTMRQPRDFVPLFASGAAKFSPGARFAYSNAGYIVLALVVEHLAGMPFIDYVQQNIFARAGMTDSGFFAFDRLPEGTAAGYLHDDDGTWRTNIYSIPVIGGGDGGAFVTAPDMANFWKALFNHTLLGPDHTAAMLTPHITTQREGRCYGYGLWIDQVEGQITRYTALGGDPGVMFASVVLPQRGLECTIMGNVEGPAWVLYGVLNQALAGK